MEHVRQFRGLDDVAAIVMSGSIKRFRSGYPLPTIAPPKWLVIDCHLSPAHPRPPHRPKIAGILMLTFTAKVDRHCPIEIDGTTARCDSEAIQHRIDRIDESYAAFDHLFDKIEQTIQQDERLQSFNASLKSSDLAPKKKSRWRSRKTVASKSNSRSGAKSKPKSSRQTGIAKVRGSQANVRTSASAKKPSTDLTEPKIKRKPR